MKKIFFGGVFLFLIFFAKNVFAENCDNSLYRSVHPNECEEYNSLLPKGSFKLYDGMNTDLHLEGETETSARNFILKVLNFALSFLGIIAIAMLIYAGFLYVTAMGEDGQVEKSKKILGYSAVGIVLILASYALVNTFIKGVASGGDYEVCYQNCIQKNSCENDFDCKKSCETECTPKNPDATIPGGENPGNNSGPRSLVKSGFIEISAENSKKFGDIIFVPLVESGTEINFSLNTQNVTEAVWKFSDGIEKGIVGATQNFSRKFYTKKSHAVAVQFYDANGELFSDFKKFVLGGISADFFVDKNSAIVGEKISLNATKSKSEFGEIVNYLWEFDGQEKNGEKISAEFLSPGEEKIIKLTVTTNFGMTATAEKKINIFRNQPVAKFAVFPNKSRPGEFIFDARESENFFGENGGLEFEWDFGDETQMVRTTSQNTTHVFTKKGNYTVQLIARQKRDGKFFESGIFSKEISVDSVMDADFDYYQ